MRHYILHLMEASYFCLASVLLAFCHFHNQFFKRNRSEGAGCYAATGKGTVSVVG